MTSKSIPNSSIARSSSIVFPSPSSTSITQQSSSSQAASSSVFSSSRDTTPSSKISSVAVSTSRLSTSTSLSTSSLPSTSISLSSSSHASSVTSSQVNSIPSSQIPSDSAIAAAQKTPLSQRPGIIAAIAASIVAGLVLVVIVFLICRRRRIRQMQVGSSTSQHLFMREHPLDDEAKGWKDSARSTAGSGWPEESPAWPSPTPLRIERQRRQSVNSVASRAPHYTVRSHASMTDVYGFGQDVAWKQAHYEDPLPAASPSHLDHIHPAIDVTPPTPRSGIINLNAPSAMPLLRSPSTASSISSEYSTASALPDIAAPESDVIYDRSVPVDDGDWVAHPQDTPRDAQWSRHLV